MPQCRCAVPYGNKKMISTLIPPPVVVAIFGLLMWMAARSLAWGQFAFPLQATVAIVLLIAGLLLMAVAVAAFIAAKTTVNPLKPSRATSLVTTGVFGISRNPIYLGDLLVLSALAVWLGNVFNLLLLALFIGYINRFQIIPEERALATLFGERYIAYCARVRRWL